MKILMAQEGSGASKTLDSSWSETIDAFVELLLPLPGVEHRATKRGQCSLCFSSQSQERLQHLPSHSPSLRPVAKKRLGRNPLQPPPPPPNLPNTKVPAWVGLGPPDLSIGYKAQLSFLLCASPPPTCLSPPPTRQ